MTIDFSCLHCGFRNSADEDEQGERIECEKCGELVSVPAPIGGRLTEKRMTVQTPGTTAPPPIRLEPAIEIPEASYSDSATFDDVPEDPGMGFRCEVMLPKVVRREERNQIQETAELVLDDVTTHMSNAPVAFQSGGFLLHVDRFEIEPSVIEVRMRLFGTLNGERFSVAGQYSIHPHDRHNNAPIVVLAQWITRLFFSSARARSIHKKARKAISYQLRERVDEVAGIRAGFPKRLGRFLRGRPW